MLKRILRPAQPIGPPPSGASLQADFVSAITNLTTSETARLTAERTEQNALDAINYAGAQHQHAVTASDDIAPELQQTIIRSSVDAQLQKAQAQQISKVTDQELERVEEEAKQRYKGKKLRVTVVDKEFQPLEAYWFNNRSGEHQGIIKSKTITGVIDDLSLRKNVLVLKPTAFSKLLVPERKFYVIYVVNPNTLQAAVELTLV